MKNNIESILKKGGIGVIQTDTIYGLVGSALNKKTVARIYKIRKRNNKKPLIVLISSIEDLKQFGLNDLPRATLRKLWPGKVSVILPCDKLSLSQFRYLHRGTGKIAFRIPNNKTLLAVLDKTGPLVAPSANLEGKPPAKNIKEAKKYFKDMVDFYESGKSRNSEASTVIEWQKNTFSLIREGAVSLNRLKKLKLII